MIGLSHGPEQTIIIPLYTHLYIYIYKFVAFILYVCVIITCRIMTYLFLLACLLVIVSVPVISFARSAP